MSAAEEASAALYECLEKNCQPVFVSVLETFGLLGERYHFPH
jgi:hypothetical protein